jgi:POT family proton-dependent oligopeptide transporter
MAPSEEKLEEKLIGIKRGHLISLLAFLLAPVIAILLASYKAIGSGEGFLEGQNIVNIIFKVVGLFILCYLAYILSKVSFEERKKLIVAIAITLFMTLFWGFHELSGSVITLFASRNVSLTFLDAAQTNSLNSMFIIILALPISWMWTKLNKHKINPRTPYKFGFGLLIAGLSFYILALSGNAADQNGMVPFSYLLLMYFLLSVGELFMSPVGLSKITDLSPKRIVAFMMGVWFLSSAYAFQLVGFIGKQLAIESDDINVGGMETLSTYIGGFDLISKYSIGAGIIVLISAPLLKKLMGNIH